MTKLGKSSNVVDRLIEYLEQNPNSPARRIASALGADKGSINSILYSNHKIFTAIGDRPPLWSLNSSTEKLGRSKKSSSASLKKSTTSKASASRPTVAEKKGPLGSQSSDWELLHQLVEIVVAKGPVDASIDSIELKENRGEPAESRVEKKSYRVDLTQDDGGYSLLQPEQLLLNNAQDDMSLELEDLQDEVEYLVRKYPGIMISEISSILDRDPKVVSSLIRDVRYLVMTADKPTSEHSEVELRQLEAISKAGTYAFPLSGDDYDDLVRRGFVKGVSSMRIIQIFGSWRAACELAGVEAPEAVRQNYERRWTERELAEAVARYLSEPEYRGANHRYEEWRRSNLITDEIPSMGTLKNYLGRSWTSVRNHGLQVLREKWLMAEDLENLYE